MLMVFFNLRYVKMKSPIILLIFFIYTMSAYAQNNKGVIITGTILEKSTENPLEFATIGIYNLDTEKFIAGTSSNTAGRFTFDSLPIGNYYITYHYTGYEKQKSAPFSIKDYTTSVDIGKLYLAPSVQALNEVVVQGKRSTYIQSIDKKHSMSDKT